MKKKLIFFSYSLCIGGIENALVNLLNKIDYDKYEVTLILIKKEGELLSKLNPNVMIKEYRISNSKIIIFRKCFNLSKRILFSLFNKNKYDYEYVRMSERIYSYFENITDKCRDVVKQIIIVMYKNI